MDARALLLLVLLLGHHVANVEASIGESIANSILNGIKNAAIGAANFVVNTTKALLAGVYRTAKEFATALASNIANSAMSARSLAEAQYANASLQNVPGTSLLSYIMYKGALPEWTTLRPMTVEASDKHLQQLSYLFVIMTFVNVGVSGIFCLIWTGLLVYYCNLKIQLRRIEEEERRFRAKKYIWLKELKKRSENIVPDEFLRKELVKAGLEWDRDDDEDDDDA